MLQTSHAVVLRTIRHGDRTTILKAWTRHAGARSYVVRTGSKKGNSSAALQPLNRVEIVADERPDLELHPVRELRVERPFLNLHQDPIRAALALFTQEVLYKVLRAETADPALDGFIHEALEVIDTGSDLRCFPLVFLLQLSGHLGFFPEPPSGNDDHFDLQEGCFYPAGVLHGHTMAPPLSLAFIQLLDVDLQHLSGASFPVKQRRELLDHLLLYFRLHIDGMGELRSPAVLHDTLA
ncbi:MAG: recombination protein O N-terminal domain-containing protein [Flavobacteriales bacterium]|jgi:DNA repair protein RecO (recombination protein O)|nr:recombination protein O N-terminal domain-containing protein [Flavobacteriales bacterium]